jgi:hypothetical protein
VHFSPWDTFLLKFSCSNSENVPPFYLYSRLAILALNVSRWGLLKLEGSNTSSSMTIKVFKGNSFDNTYNK